MALPLYLSRFFLIQINERKVKNPIHDIWMNEECQTHINKKCVQIEVSPNLQAN